MNSADGTHSFNKISPTIANTLLGVYFFEQIVVQTLLGKPCYMIYLPSRKLTSQVQWMHCGLPVQMPSAGCLFHSFAQHVTKDLRRILCAISNSSRSSTATPHLTCSPVDPSVCVDAPLHYMIARQPGCQGARVPGL